MHGGRMLADNGADNDASGEREETSMAGVREQPNVETAKIMVAYHHNHNHYFDRANCGYICHQSTVYSSQFLSNDNASISHYTIVQPDASREELQASVTRVLPQSADIAQQATLREGPPHLRKAVPKVITSAKAASSSGIRFLDLFSSPQRPKVSSPKPAAPAKAPINATAKVHAKTPAKAHAKVHAKAPTKAGASRPAKSAPAKPAPAKAKNVTKTIRT